MRLLFAIIGLLGFSLSATAASEWLYYKEYPWVYDHVSKDWLYLRGATDGNIYAYRNSTKAWEKLVVPDTEWDEKFKIWSQNPELYVGQEVLDVYKKAKYDRLTALEDVDGFTFMGRNVGNIDPVFGVTSLQKLHIFAKGLRDISALSKLTNLQELIIGDNEILDISPLKNLQSLRILDLQENGPLEQVGNEWVAVSKLSDISALSNLTNLECLYLMHNAIIDISPLTGLSNLTKLNLWNNNISDITPLEGLTNLMELNLSGNNISDITPLAELTNLTTLQLRDIPITASQKAMLEEALPNTNIDW